MLLGIVIVWNDHKEPRDQITDLQTKELHMKRLLGLLLVMGMVGCGGKTVDVSKMVTRGGLRYEVNSETPFTGVTVSKHDNGKKMGERTYKDGKREGLTTMWYETGQKSEEVTYKDGEQEGLSTFWYVNGQKETEGTWKDGKEEGLHTFWYENGQKRRQATYKNGKPMSGTNWDKEGNEIK